MSELESAREFLTQIVHFKYAGEALTICGVTALGMLTRRFLYIGEGGRKTCKDCAHELGKRIREDSEKA